MFSELCLVVFPTQKGFIATKEPSRYHRNQRHRRPFPHPFAHPRLGKQRRPLSIYTTFRPWFIQSAKFSVFPAKIPSNGPTIWYSSRKDNTRQGMCESEMIYYAKSADEHGNRITNRQHLQQVAVLARQFGVEIGMPFCSEMAGMTHDFGKYSTAFQNVLEGTASNIDHAICAAAFLYGCGIVKKCAYRMVACVTAAHHSFLQAYDSLEPELKELIAGKGSGTCHSGKQAALFGSAAYGNAKDAFFQDFSDFRFKALEKFPGESLLEKMLRTRLLFSCLVDADYTASAGQPPMTSEGLQPDRLLKDLYAHMQTLRRTSLADRGVNDLRDEVFRQCGETGDAAPGFFTLTAPTGVGKTLALLHFALRHCAAYGKRRIILVLPFLTLTEQSQKVYEKLIPHILADHSQSRLSEEQQELAARWDAPFIITTSVRFFEGLFSCRPKDCRKLHNIAQSVVLFDEAQSLPADLAAATMRAADALCRQYGCTIALSTATQPDFSALPGMETWHAREILPDAGRYYAALRRTRVDWRLDRPTPLPELAGEMAQETSVCAIVNLRRHARQLYDALQTACPEEEQDSLFFLTTDLCPAHRSDSIAAIRARLRDGKPCRVVATQCIEAGVDLDFASMYRALAPLEAIIQASGRCNRNGTMPGGGLVTVFIPEDIRDVYPGDFYRRAAETVKLMQAEGDLDIHAPTAIAAYYHRLFGATQERPELSQAMRAEDYVGVEQAYRLIRQQGVQVVVPYPPKIELFQTVRQQARAEGWTAALLREAAPILVSSYQEEQVRQHCEQIPWRGRRTHQTAESDFYILCTGHENCYRANTGLQWLDGQSVAELFML